MESQIKMENERLLDSEKLKAILTSVYQKDEQGESLEGIMNALKQDLSQMVKKEEWGNGSNVLSRF